MNGISENLNRAAILLVESSDDSHWPAAELRDEFAAIADALQQGGTTTCRQLSMAAVGLLDEWLQTETPQAETPDVLRDVLAVLSDMILDGIGENDRPLPPRITELLDLDGEVRTEPVEDSSDEDSLATYSADPEMLAGFVSEAREHLEAAEPELLALEACPDDEDAINTVFRSFHSIKGVAGFLELTDISTLAHEAENLLDKARDGELALVGAAMDLALASLDTLQKCVDKVEESISTGEPPSHPDELPLLLPNLRAFLRDGSNSSVTDALPNSDQELAEGGTDADSGKGSAPTVSAAVKSTRRAGLTSGTVKVDRGRLDELIDLIGELVIAESMVHERLIGTQHNDSMGDSDASQLRKITRELQELSLSLRMVPVNGLFQKMSRLVRDLSRKVGKPIDFHVEGSETELDKTIVDEAADPLVHIVRNAVDHGIESHADDRIAAGKPERGQVTLRAYHQGGSIYIDVEDDGKGLQRDKILAKAIDLGIVTPDQNLSDPEIYKLIFAPGFSTASEVTDVSGRGVGMDVVRRNIETLRGSVDVQSAVGKGTTISLRLPLTLAIIDGMVVRVAGQRYIIPTSAIVELIRPRHADLASVTARGEMLAVRGQNVPFFRIAELFELSGAENNPTEATIVLIEDKGRMVGLLVDEIAGQQQVVIKSLGDVLQRVQGLAGCAVMPDGAVGLILDIHGLLTLARSRTNDGAASRTVAPTC